MVSLRSCYLPPPASNCEKCGSSPFMFQLSSWPSNSGGFKWNGLFWIVWGSSLCMARLDRLPEFTLWRALAFFSHWTLQQLYQSLLMHELPTWTGLYHCASWQWLTDPQGMVHNMRTYKQGIHILTTDIEMEEDDKNVCVVTYISECLPLKTSCYCTLNNGGVGLFVTWCKIWPLLVHSIHNLHGHIFNSGNSQVGPSLCCRDIECRIQRGLSNHLVQLHLDFTHTTWCWHVWFQDMNLTCPILPLSE